MTELQQELRRKLVCVTGNRKLCRAAMFGPRDGGLDSTTKPGSQRAPAAPIQRDGQVGLQEPRDRGWGQATGCSWGQLWEQGTKAAL